MNSIDTLNFNASLSSKPLDDKQKPLDIPLNDYKSNILLIDFYKEFLLFVKSILSYKECVK